MAEARRISAVFSIYSGREVEELLRKIEGGRDRFITQESRANRARCLCGIDNEIKDGNDGSLPLIDEWSRMISS